jgi:hypothetical protein
MLRPELHAVVEIGARPGQLWFEPPGEPWPRFVRLWGSTPAEDVALFLVVASSYGRAGHESAKSIDNVVSNFPAVLPGGIGVVLDDRIIMPSCCCGLEHWPEWRQVLTTGQSPWTGHDPAPLVELRDDIVQIWSDGGMGEKPSHETPITFGRSAFALAVESVAQDLHDFLHPLRVWLDRHAPHASAVFVSKFAARFVRI